MLCRSSGCAAHVAWGLLVASLLIPSRGEAAELPAGFVYLRDIEPRILQDIRYAGPDNFTGAKVPGYDDRECVLRAPVADALKRANAVLLPRGLGLKVYDCYRPERAVKAFVLWASDNSTSESSKRFHPRVAKTSLVPLGYIAAKSSHSLGVAVDLTIVQLPAQTGTTSALAPHHGDCTEPAERRAPDTGIDMGSGFDCFDPKSHTFAPGLSATQAGNRKLLVDVMTRHGFANYPREWWHFTHRPSAASATPQDFPIRR